MKLYVGINLHSICPSNGAVEPRASQGKRRGATFFREAESAPTPWIGGARAEPIHGVEPFGSTAPISGRPKAERAPASGPLIRSEQIQKEE